MYIQYNVLGYIRIGQTHRAGKSEMQLLSDGIKSIKLKTAEAEVLVPDQESKLRALVLVKAYENAIRSAAEIVLP